MIKREFIENNLIKVLNYLPGIIKYQKHNYYLKIDKVDNIWFIEYYNSFLENTIIDAQEKDFVQVIIDIIQEIDIFIPDFINNLIDI